MLVGGSTYAYLIGDICGVLSNTDPATTEFKNTMDTLNKCVAWNRDLYIDGHDLQLYHPVQHNSLSHQHLVVGFVFPLTLTLDMPLHILNTL